MSILIKGMKMPKKEMILILFPDGKVATEEYEIGANAKAVEVPPHGRLIDADALMKTCGMATDCYDCPNGEHGWCKRSQDAANICEAIEDAQTIIEAEEAYDES